MLAQIISEKAFVWLKHNFVHIANPVYIKFGTIVFVVEVDQKFGKATILHNEMIYRISLTSLEFVSSEKDVLSWEDIKQREADKKQQIIDSIENLVVE